MENQEIKTFFEWCENTIKSFEYVDAEESEHYYLDSVFVGGWAGDSREYFYKQSDTLAKYLRMYDAMTEKPLN